MAMIVRERLYTVEDVWRLECAPENDGIKFCLIDGELLHTMSPGLLHGRLALRIGRFIADFADENNLGEAAVEVGHRPSEHDRTLLFPDVSFDGAAKAAQPASVSYAAYFPDLAVEIISPSQTLAQARRKARVYLRHGTDIVWLIDMMEKKAEVWALDDDGRASSEWIESAGELDGGSVLPGFKLPLKKLFRD